MGPTNSLHASVQNSEYNERFDFKSLHNNHDIFYDEAVLIFFMNTIAKSYVKTSIFIELRMWKSILVCWLAYDVIIIAVIFLLYSISSYTL